MTQDFSVENPNGKNHVEFSEWFYFSTTQGSRRPRAHEAANFSGTTWWWLHLCWLLVRMVNAPKRQPLACLGVEGAFIVPIVCHTQRGWLISGRYPDVVPFAWMTWPPEQGYIPKLSFSDYQFWEHFQYGKQVVASHPTKEPRESKRHSN